MSFDMINGKLLEPIVGNLNDLNTNQKDNLVSAINEINVKIGKLLWSGEFKSGSINIEGFSKYTLIAVKGSIGAICIGTKSFGMGGFLRYASTGDISICAYRLSHSGDIVSITENDKGFSENSQIIPITEIYGIF